MNNTETDADLVEPVADAYLAAIRTAEDVEAGVERANTYLQRRFAAAITGESITPRTAAGEELEPFDLGPNGQVDSHVLGQAMEKVVTQLHGSMGAFYTPDEITEFMSGRTIRPRVWDSVGVDPDTVDGFDSWVTEASTQNREAALEELQTIQVCDPACGSGHFLVAALDEIVRLKLTLHDALGNEVPEWKVARRTAQDNIYGVDLADEAVAMAKLRIRLRVLERLPSELASEYVSERPVAMADGGQVDGGVVRDRSGEPMSDAEIRRMLRTHALDGWKALQREVDTTLHRDGGATIHIRLNQDHVEGMAESW